MRDLDFIFGPLAAPEIGGKSFRQPTALPTIYLLRIQLISILYHVGIMQLIVRWVGRADQEDTRHFEGGMLCAAANLRGSASPLVIRPYLSLTRPAHL